MLYMKTNKPLSLLLKGRQTINDPQLEGQSKINTNNTTCIYQLTKVWSDQKSPMKAFIVHYDFNTKCKGLKYYMDLQVPY